MAVVPAGHPSSGLGALERDEDIAGPTLCFEGGGPDLVFSYLELNQRLDLAAQQLAPGISFGQIGVPPGTDLANFKISGSDFSLAGHVSVLVNATDKVSFGARYMSRHTIKRDDLELESAQVPTGLRTPVALPGIPAGHGSGDAGLVPLAGAHPLLELLARGEADIDPG